MTSTRSALDEAFREFDALQALDASMVDGANAPGAGIRAMTARQRPNLIDLTGQRFGRWTVRAIHPERYRCCSRAGKVTSYDVLWHCICDCGTERLVRGIHLRHGKSKSCGKCIRRSHGVTGRHSPDISGKRFGRWTVLPLPPERRLCKAGSTVWYWPCRCDCGTERLVWEGNLKRGETLSCGCLGREKARARIKHGHTRGGKQTRAYAAWRNMLRRCFDPNFPGYHYWGGRDDIPITVCKRWHSFINLLADMGEHRPACRSIASM